MIPKVQQKQVMRKYFKTPSSSTLSLTDLPNAEQDQKMAPVVLVWLMAFIAIGGMSAVYMGIATGDLALTFVIGSMIAGAMMCKLRRTFL